MQDLVTHRRERGSGESTRTMNSSASGVGQAVPVQQPQSHPPPESVNGNATGSKRRRIALACLACRSRKSRCDGARPKCSACEDLGFDCAYIQSSSSSNVIVGKEYLVALEDRLAIVEEAITALKYGNYDFSSNAAPQSVGRDTPQRQLRFDNNSNHDFRRHSEAVVVDGDAVQDTSELTDPSDGMGAIVFADEEDCGFFGPSSNIAFMRHISRAVARVYRFNQTWATPGTQESLALEGGIMSVSRPASPISRGTRGRPGSKNEIPVQPYSLPPEDETLEILHNYFSDTGLLFPYLHEESFLETYAEMKRTNFTKVRRTWLGLLNMVLALATSTSIGNDVSAEKRAEQSDVYYQRAVELCDKQILRGTSLEVVQYLLLMGQYLQGTQKSIQAWTIHGLAVKAAFQLGLHSSEALRRFEPLEREIRRRTWFGCVVLDRTLSMTFGRPASIPDDYVRLDLPSNYEDLVPSPTPVEDRKHNSLTFFNATITLYKVLWKVIDLLYGGNIGCDGQPSIFDIVARLFEMEHQLVSWRQNLPPNLQLRNSHEISSDENALPTERYRIILTLRYHNLRILIHRLILVKFLDLSGKAGSDNQELALLQQIGSNSVHICVQSSTEIISIVNIITHSTGIQRTFLGAWWFSLYYTFNAALVIFASLLISQNATIASSLPSISTGLSRKNLDEAVDALDFLDHGNKMVEKCRKCLKQLGHVLEILSSNDFLLDANSLTGAYPPPPPGFESNIAFSMALNQTNTTLSPLGMDLGEFMIEGDLEFLNHFSMPIGVDGTGIMGQQAGGF